MFVCIVTPWSSEPLGQDNHALPSLWLTSRCLTRDQPARHECSWRRQSPFIPLQPRYQSQKFQPRFLNRVLHIGVTLAGPLPLAPVGACELPPLVTRSSGHNALRARNLDQPPRQRPIFGKVHRAARISIGKRQMDALEFTSVGPGLVMTFRKTAPALRSRWPIESNSPRLRLEFPVTAAHVFRRPNGVEPRWNASIS